MKYTGRIYKRGPGNYEAIVNFKDDAGKYRNMSKTVRGKKEIAEDFLRQWLTELENPKFQATDQLLGDWLIYWIDNIAKKDLERNTYESYRWEINKHIIPMIGQAPLSDLLPLDIQKFYDHKSNDGKLKASGGLSNRSVTYIHSILNQALTKAVDLEMIEKNPCDKVKPGKDKRKQRKGQDIVSLSKEQLTDFIKSCREHRDFALIYTAAYTGARQSELLGLKWDDVEWDEKSIYIHMALHRHNDGSYEHRPRTKNSSSTRTISITDADSAVLKQHRKDQKELQLAAGSNWKNEFNLVFTEADGSPMDRRNQTGRFTNLANKLLQPPKIESPKTDESEVKTEKSKKEKAKQFTFHGLRHTHATILLSDGEYINVVSERLGHADVETTLRTYGHVLPKKREDVAERFARLVMPGI